MLKKVLFTLGLLSLFLLISCNNLIENDYGSNQLAFSIGDAAGTIESAVKSNENINNDTRLNVQCEFLRGETVVGKQSVTTTLKDLDSTTFSLKNIPNGNNYYISIKISYNNVVIYDALSDVIILSEDQKEANVSLQLKQKNSSITFDPCDGSFKEGEIIPSFYFFNSSIVLPVPEKAHNQFDGWYLSKDFTPENKVESLGKTCFLGDVTLYAKWIGLDKLAGVNITPDVKNIDFGDSIDLKIATEGATIHYTTDGSEPTENSPVYNGSIEVTDYVIKDNDKITVKAIAVKKGMENSDLVTRGYTLKRYTVTFKHNGHGTEPDVLNLKKGDPITSPGELNEKGYTFGGWYGDSGFTEPSFDFENTKMETSNVEIYAKWTPITYNVEFNSNGADKGSSVQIQVLTYDKADKLNKNTFVKTGYKFIGWNIAAGGTADTNIVDENMSVLNLSTNQDATVKLYAQWSPLPDVTNFSLATGDKQITVTWENPTENIFDHTIISYGSEIIPVAKAQQSYSINGLTNGTKYNIKIQASYKTCGLENNSSGIEKGQYAMNPLTEAPVQVSNIVKFGDFPQSWLKDTSILTNDTVIVNGWFCKYGTDGYYYTEIPSNPYDPDNVENKTFNDGTTIHRDTSYYFKIEPIEWLVVSELYKGYKLLVSNKALEVRCFSETDTNPYYETSDIRTHLNGVFCNNAFSPSGKAKISPVTLDNNKTTDTIFLLSRDENNFYRLSRQVKSTEYVRSLYSTIDMTESYRYSVNWWERSKLPEPENGVHCRWSGGSGGQLGASCKWVCTVPSLCVDPSLLP